MDFMQYPTFEFVENRGHWFPNINLPLNYKELVPNFYKQKRKNKIEEYTKLIEEKFAMNKLEIRLQWDDEEGLRNIDFGSSGLDLNEQTAAHFCEHNLNTITSLMSGMIAMKYISELYKSKIN